jgi:hypothetical protein
MTENERQQQEIIAELATIDRQRTQNIEEFLSGADARRQDEISRNLDTLHLLTNSKLTRLGLLSRAFSA